MGTVIYFDFCCGGRELRARQPNPIAIADQSQAAPLAPEIHDAIVLRQFHEVVAAAVDYFTAAAHGLGSER